MVPKIEWKQTDVHDRYDTDDTVNQFNVRLKDGISQLNLPHGTKTLKKWKKTKLKMKMDMLRSIGKQSGKSVESVLKKKETKATEGRICGIGRFEAWSERASR